MLLHSLQSAAHEALSQPQQLGTSTQTDTSRYVLSPSLLVSLKRPHASIYMQELRGESARFSVAFLTAEATSEGRKVTCLLLACGCPIRPCTVT
jgi:hypothetical protein